jgi:hypothetical protein
MHILIHYHVLTTVCGGAASFLQRLTRLTQGSLLLMLISLVVRQRRRPSLQTLPLLLRPRLNLLPLLLLRPRPSLQILLLLRPRLSLLTLLLRPTLSLLTLLRLRPRPRPQTLPLLRPRLSLPLKRPRLKAPLLLKR